MVKLICGLVSFSHLVYFLHSSLAESKPDWRWQLTASGRFAHRKEYIADIGNQFGLKVVHYEALDGFRHELGTDVRGHAFLMRKETLSKNDEL